MRNRRIKTFKGNSPMNAKIKISYGNGKPKVTFRYIDKKKQYKDGAYNFFVFWLGIPATIITLFFYSADCNTTGRLIWTFSIPFTYYLLPAIVYYPFKRHWDNVYPKLNAALASKKYIVFRSKDIKSEQGKYFCEIPLFSNVVCNYRATKDFSKYLNEFEIKEHKFSYWNSLRRRKSRKIQEWYWYARWNFTEKPEKGKIEVVFK